MGITGEGGRVGTFWEGIGAEEQLRKLDDADKIIKRSHLEETVQEALFALDAHLKGQGRCYKISQPFNVYVNNFTQSAVSSSFNHFTNVYRSYGRKERGIEAEVGGA